VWVLFAAVAIGTSAPLLGFPVPIGLLIALGLLALVRSETVEAAETYSSDALSRDDDEPSVLHDGRVELVDRAAAVQRELRIQSNAVSAYADADTDAIEDAAALAALRASSDERIEALTTGTGASDAKPPRTVPLPVGTSPAAVALSVGPFGDWWQNGIEAVRRGWLLAALPVAFSIYVVVAGVVDRAPWSLMQDSTVGVVASISQEMLFWLVTAFSLGALLAYLPGRVAVVKGALLAGVYIMTVAGLHLLTWLLDALFKVGRLFHLDSTDWTFRGFELLLFLAALGLLLDMTSVDKTAARIRSLYGLDDVRKVVLYLAPVAATVVIVGGQLYRGEAFDAVETLLNSAGSFLPEGGTGGL
jgi:hypothetical protein